MAQKRAALLEKRLRREKESQQKKMQQEAELEQKKEEARYVDTSGEEIHTYNQRSHSVERCRSGVQAVSCVTHHKLNRV